LMSRPYWKPCSTSSATMYKATRDICSSQFWRKPDKAWHQNVKLRV
jgi:hypothetical protein